MKFHELDMMIRKRDRDSSAIVSKILIFVMLAPVSLFLSAAAVKLGWLWFVVPLGAQPIGYIHAIGLGFLTRYLTKDSTTEKGCQEKEYAELVAEGLAAPGVSLLFMWLFHLAM